MGDSILRPIVTVILATYNGERYLPALLHSLLGQTCQPNRLVLRDDASSDASVDIVERWAFAADMPLQIVQGARLGPAQSFLQALEAAESADVYMFADQDDVWLPFKIERALGFLHSGPDAPPALYASQLAVVDAQLRFQNLTPCPRHLSFGSAACESLLAGCTMAFNDAFRECIIRGMPRQVAMHDWWLYLLATATATTLLFDATPTILYRQHGQNAVGVGAVGFAKLRERLARFVGPDSTVRSIQLQQLLQLYGAELDAPASALTHQLLAARQSLLARLRAALTAPIRRQTRGSALSTRLSLLTNRF